MGLWFFSFHPAAKFLGSHISAFLSVKGSGIPVPHDYDSLSRIIDHPVAWLLTRPLFWAVMGVVVAPYGFFRSWRSLKSTRCTRNIPWSTYSAATISRM